MTESDLLRVAFEPYQAKGCVKSLVCRGAGSSVGKGFCPATDRWLYNTLC